MSNNIKFAEINIMYTEEYNLFNFLDWFSELKLDKIILTIDNQNIEIINNSMKILYNTKYYTQHTRSSRFFALISTRRLTFSFRRCCCCSSVKLLAACDGAGVKGSCILRT